MNTQSRTPFLFLTTLGLLIILLPVLNAHAQLSESEENIDSSPSTDSSLQAEIDAGTVLNVPADTTTTDPADSDGDGHADSAIREGGQTVDAGTIPENQSESMNSPTDLDVSSKEIEVIEYRNGDSSQLQVREVDKSTPGLMEILSMDSATPLLFQGINIRVTVDNCDANDSGDCDDGDTREFAPSASFGLRVSGVDVRGWNPEQKKDLLLRASTITTVETPNDFGIWLAAKILEDESITEADIGSEEVVLRYETKARLFGIIPINVPVKALGRTERNPQTGKEIKLGLEIVTPEVIIDYPWYGFLLRKKPIQEQVSTDILEINTNYQSSMRAADLKKLADELVN